MKTLRVFLTVVCVFVLAIAAYGQDSGNISGVITDESGAVIPNAKIVVTNRETGLARDLTSAANGGYNVVSLPPGVYGVRIEATGFQGRERVATVAVGSSTRVDFLMKVGTTKDVVVVEEAAPQMNY